MSAPAATIKEFRLGKGRTSGSEKTNLWEKKYLELTVSMPSPYTEEMFVEALNRSDYIIDHYLGEPETSPAAQIPEFDSQLLMNHQWKGKKTGENQWAFGSNAWGWDFADKFPAEVIKVLEKGPVAIDKYEFSLNETGTLVQTKEKKEARKERKQR